MFIGDPQVLIRALRGEPLHKPPEPAEPPPQQGHVLVKAVAQWHADAKSREATDADEAEASLVSVTTPSPEFDAQTAPTEVPKE
jgi:hypothetical protein